MRPKIGSVVAGTALLAASAALGQNPRQMPVPDLGGAIGWLNSAPVSDTIRSDKKVTINC